MLKNFYKKYRNLLSSEYVAQHPDVFTKHIIVHILSELVSFTTLSVVMVCIYYIVLSFFPEIFAMIA